MVFLRFWAFNTAGKTVTKVGIYALPPRGGPQKVENLVKNEFLSILWVRFNLSLLMAQENLSPPNFNARGFYKILY
jgi:hypothetical protein